MSPRAEQLAHDVLELPAEERAQIAHELLLSLDPGSDEDVEQAWEEEIIRRMQRIGEEGDPGRPADEVFRDLRTQYQS